MSERREKFTPGPWRVDPMYWPDVQTADGALEVACTGDSVLIGGPTDSKDAQSANAHLIAAAPELYDYILKNGHDDEAKALLAKARGEE